jgi:hypothetical protein
MHVPGKIPKPFRYVKMPELMNYLPLLSCLLSRDFHSSAFSDLRTLRVEKRFSVIAPLCCG